MKITISEPRNLPKIRDEFFFLHQRFLYILITLGPIRLFERGECGFRDFFPTGQPCSTFESNIAYTLRFMIDTKVWTTCREYSEITLPQVVGMNWIEIPAGQYKLVSEKDKKSTCQIELKVR